MMNMNKYPYLREIYFSNKNDNAKRKLLVSIKGPYLIQEGDVDFKFDEGTSKCTIEFEGLEELNNDVYGVDGLHALSLAVDIDPILKSVSSKYNFYWNDGSPYFE